MASLDLPMLVTDMKASYQEMGPYRKRLMLHARESAGGNYGSNPVDNPINFLSLYERIMMGHLVGGDPRMMASTFDKQIKSMVGVLEEDCNRGFKKLGLRDVLRTAVRDALYQVGILKVALTAPAEARFGGYAKSVGSPAMSNIDFTDFVCDMRAKKFKECSYLGHRYCLLYEDVKKSTVYNRKARSAIVPKSDDMISTDGEDRLSSIGRGYSHSAEFEEYVEVWELYLPRRNQIVTFDADGDYETPLLIQDWVGPACGPYHFLSYCEIIGQLLPKGPIMDLINLHIEQNTHWKHLNNQATLQKSVVFYQHAEDAQKAENAKEGDFIKSNSPDSVQEKVVHSGPNQNVVAWVGLGSDFMNELAGNIRALGGLGSQADTATQEKLIVSSASALVNAMGQRVHQFTQDVMRAYSWFRWKHPRETLKGPYAAPGGEATMERSVEPIERFGTDFEAMDINIDPYSLMAQTPQGKLQAIQMVMEKYIIPLVPMFGQPGVGELLETYIRMVAKLTNTPEIIDLVEKLVGMQGPAEEQAEPAQSMPNETTRTYERVSRSGMSDQGHRQVLTQLASGGQPNPDAPAGGLGQMRAG